MRGRVSKRDLVGVVRDYSNAIGWPIAPGATDLVRRRDPLVQLMLFDRHSGGTFRPFVVTHCTCFCTATGGVQFHVQELSIKLRECTLAQHAARMPQMLEAMRHEFLFSPFAALDAAQ